MSQPKIGFIGAGNMATAIINGIIKADIISANSIYVYDLSAEKMSAMSKKGLRAAASGQEVVKNCDVVFLAVKPQNYEEVLTGLKGYADDKKVFVSIAAGISTQYVTKLLGVNCPVVRAMPNTPLLLSKGATALCRGEGVSDDDFSLVSSLFAASGIVEEIMEDKMNEIIAVNGSSPAYIYLFAKAVIDYAVSVHIDAGAAMRLFCKTLEGSAAMLTDSGNTPDELIKMVSSPGGTTLKALESLKEHGFYEAVIEAMKRCTERAVELGR